MGGSGGNVGQSESDYKKIIEETRKKLEKEEFETEVNRLIGDYVAQCARDAQLTNDRLERIKGVLGQEYEGTFETRFGGSVKKKTYVEGLSDVDVLVQINKTELMAASPREILNYLRQTLTNARMSAVNTIEIGKLAVTITYNNGDEIQLLPAIKKGDGYKIPSATNKNEWSTVIRPQKFAEKLTQVNQQNANKVIPIIKVVKGIVSTLPENRQLTGYHIESLAIEIFKNPTKSQSNRDMLLTFFKQSKDLVKNSIKDKTGQSYHVDDYLGDINSQKRREASYDLERIYNKMNNASEKGDINQWKSILGD